MIERCGAAACIRAARLVTCRTGVIGMPTNCIERTTTSFVFTQIRASMKSCPPRVDGRRNATPSASPHRMKCVLRMVFGVKIRPWSSSRLPSVVHLPRVLLF